MFVFCFAVVVFVFLGNLLLRSQTAYAFNMFLQLGQTISLSAAEPKLDF